MNALAAFLTANGTLLLTFGSGMVGDLVIWRRVPSDGFGFGWMSAGLKSVDDGQCAAEYTPFACLPTEASASRLQRLINADEDAIRLWPLSRSCCARIVNFGRPVASPGIRDVVL